VGVHALENDTLCSRLETQWPGMNLTLFSRVCHEPAFESAYERYGSFMGQGVTSLHGLVVQYEYVIVGASPCGNLTNGPPNETCVEEVAWFGNATTGVVTGPHFYERPAISFGQGGGSPIPALAGLEGTVLFVGVAATLVVMVAAIVLRTRAQT